jgi:hypothetical protein
MPKAMIEPSAGDFSTENMSVQRGVSPASMRRLSS